MLHLADDDDDRIQDSEGFDEILLFSYLFTDTRGKQRLDAPMPRSSNISSTSCLVTHSKRKQRSDASIPRSCDLFSSSCLRMYSRREQQSEANTQIFAKAITCSCCLTCTALYLKDVATDRRSKHRVGFEDIQSEIACSDWHQNFKMLHILP